MTDEIQDVALVLDDQDLTRDSHGVRVAKGPRGVKAPVCRADAHGGEGRDGQLIVWRMILPSTMYTLERDEDAHAEDLVVVVHSAPAGGAGRPSAIPRRAGADDLPTDGGAGPEHGLFQKRVIEGHRQILGEVIADPEENRLDIPGLRVLIRFHEVVPAEEAHLLDQGNAVVAPELVPR